MTAKDYESQIKTYRQFWLFYLGQHSKFATKVWHTVGLTIGIAIGTAGIFFGHWGYVGLGIVVSYGFAWYSHFFVEKNTPATFRWPVWSFISEFRLAGKTLLGRYGRTPTKPVAKTV